MIANKDYSPLKKNAPKTILLICKDGENVEVPQSFMHHSDLIRGMIVYGGHREIPLPNLEKAMLDKILLYTQHLETEQQPEIDKPIKTSNMEELITPWFVKYVDMAPDDLFELTMAAYYLQMQGLMELTACKMACALRGKTMRNVRNYYKDIEAQQKMQSGENPTDDASNQKWAEESFSN